MRDRSARAGALGRWRARFPPARARNLEHEKKGSVGAASLLLHDEVDLPSEHAVYAIGDFPGACNPRLFDVCVDGVTARS